MRGEDQCAATGPDLRQSVPQETSGHRVHPRRRLVQKHDRGIANQRYRRTQLPLVSPTRIEIKITATFVIYYQIDGLFQKNCQTYNVFNSITATAVYKRLEQRHIPINLAVNELTSRKSHQIYFQVNIKYGQFMFNFH